MCCSRRTSRPATTGSAAARSTASARRPATACCGMPAPTLARCRPRPRRSRTRWRPGRSRSWRRWGPGARSLPGSTRTLLDSQEGLQRVLCSANQVWTPKPAQVWTPTPAGCLCLTSAPQARPHGRRGGGPDDARPAAHLRGAGADVGGPAGRGRQPVAGGAPGARRPVAAGRGHARAGAEQHAAAAALGAAALGAQQRGNVRRAQLPARARAGAPAGPGPPCGRVGLGL